MRKRALLVIAVLALLVAVPACGGDGDSAEDTGTGKTDGTPVKGGILRVGSINYIDSLNPFNYIESQAYQAMLMIYPQLVQYATGDDGLVIEGDWAESWETSPDGKDWTFSLKPGGKWSDGTPLTANDAAWTINTIVKYAAGPTAVAAPALGHVVSAEATDENTLVIHYDAPVGNVLAQLEQLFIVPQHVWEPLVGANGKNLKTFHPEQNLPVVSAGAYTIKEYEKKGTTVFIPWEGYYEKASNAEAVTLTYFTNSDSMISELRQGNLDWVDQVPFNAVKVLEEDDSLVVNKVPGAETTNITWNSNPRKPKNRELLDPQVKKALSMCVDRERIIEVVFNGYASLVESLVGHIAGPMENPNLGPLEYDCEAGNQMLDDLGYERGSDGTRIAPATTGEYAQEAHPMEYEVITPTSTDFNVDRSFEIVQEGFAEAGVNVDAEGRRRHDRQLRARDRRQLRRRGLDRLRHLRHGHVGLGRLHRPGLHALGRHEGPVVLLERHGLGQPRVRRDVPAAGNAGRPRGAQAARLGDAADDLRQLRLHPAHEPRVHRRALGQVGGDPDGSERVLEGILDVALHGRVGTDSRRRAEVRA